MTKDEAVVIISKEFVKATSDVIETILKRIDVIAEAHLALMGRIAELEKEAGLVKLMAEQVPPTEAN